MKKVIAIGLAVLLGVFMVPFSAMADATIEKELSQESANLGDVVTVTIKVAVSGDQAPVTIVDTLPDDLSYLEDSFEVNGNPEEPTVDGQEISYTLEADGEYTIEFKVQVTSAPPPSEEEYKVLNEAMVLKDDDPIARATDDLVIYPYEGFKKVARLVYEENEDGGTVEVGELVQWDMIITVPNNFGWDITGLILCDRLGGELGMAGDEVDNDRDGYADADDPENPDPGDLPGDYNTIPDGTLEIRTTGKTNKVHFCIKEIDITSGSEPLIFTLGVFTDHNPAKNDPGKQCYTSPSPPDEPYELNSGAVIKFTDPETLLQLSAHTASIPVEVVEPE